MLGSALQFALSNRGEEYNWNLSARRRDARIEYSEYPDNTNLTLVHLEHSAAFRYTRSVSMAALEGSIAVTSPGGHPALELGGKATIQFHASWINRLWLAINRGYNAFSLHAAYAGASLDIVPGIQGLSTTLGGEFPVTRKTFLDVEEERYTGSPDEDPSEYSSSNRASSVRRLVSLTHKNSGFVLGAGYASTDISGGGEMDYTDLAFSRHNLVFGTMENAWVHATGMDHADTSFDISGSWRFLDGKMVGSVETWPFTSVIVSAIENRYNYRLFGSFRLWSFEGKKWWGSDNIRVSTGISCHILRPAIHLQAWVPAFLVFGFKDYTDTQLDISSAVIGGVFLGAIFTLPVCTIAVQGNQLFPVAITRNATPEPAPGDPSQPIPEAKSAPTGSHADGGRWFTVTLSKRF